MKATHHTARTITIHFRWEPEEIEAMLAEKIICYMAEKYPDQTFQRDITVGSRYDGGVDFSATVTIRDNG